MELIGQIYGWGMAFVFAGLIVVPYLLGRRHLMTAWNFFLLGSISFFAVNTAQTIPISAMSQEFESSVFVRFMFTGALFYLIVTVTYFWPMRKAPRVTRFFVNRLPVPTPGMTLTAAIVCLALSFSVWVLPTLPIVSLIMGNNAPLIAIASAALSFWLFLRSPLLPLTWYVVVPIFAIAAVATLLYGSGRQPLLGLALVPPFVMYWMKAKNWRPLPTLAAIAFAGLAAVVVLTGYSQVRHDTKDIQDPFERAFVRIQRIPTAILTLRSAGKLTAEIQGQNAVWCSLICIDLTDDDTMDKEPLFTLQFMVGNWVPRQFWSDKPKAIGFRLPKIYRFHSPVNWGPGIVGHMYHEGGWWMVFIYGPLIGIFFRNIDYAVTNHSDNPFTLALLVPVAGQFIALSRGDIGLFLFQILGAFIYIFFVFWILRTLGAQKYQHPNPLEPQGVQA